MAYTKTNWQNGAVPAINADNLNHMEQGIAEAINRFEVITLTQSLAARGEGEFIADLSSYIDNVNDYALISGTMQFYQYEYPSGGSRYEQQVWTNISKVSVSSGGTFSDVKIHPIIELYNDVKDSNKPKARCTLKNSVDYTQNASVRLVLMKVS